MSSILDTVHPPVPDPARPPRTAAEMEKAGEREGEVLRDASQPDGAIEDDPQFATNGE